MDRAVSYLYYADRLYQLPLGVIGVAIGVVLLPDLSRKLRAGNEEGAVHSQNRALELSLFLTLPAAIALMAMPAPILHTIFEHGAFTRADTLAVAPAVLAFAVGLPAFSMSKVFQPGFFAREDTRDGLLMRMKEAMDKTLDEAWRKRAGGLPLANRQQALTLASIIEKETGVASERSKVSAVFINRLRQKMKLESDPTTIYGIWERYSGNLHRQDLLTPTPFNTYTVPALPVGPIGNPGLQSIEAAIHPSASEYLFFVSMNEGRHRFSRTLQEHNGAVRKYQLDPKARAGRSWRQLTPSGN